jgi:hypothetical protein
VPDLVCGTPGIAETCKPKDDAKETGRHYRWLESAAHRLPQTLAIAPYDDDASVVPAGRAGE